MKVGIVGMGFVGSALESGLKESVNTLKIDPKLNTKVFDLVAFNPEFIFICVPTPLNDNGSQDIRILKSVMRELNENKISSIIVIKSTVAPDKLCSLNESYDFVYNPEFLREKTAQKDFINGDLVLFGGKRDLCITVSDFFKEYTLCKNKEHFITDIATASLVKYSINSYLASKVVFFNQLNEIFKASTSKETWENFITFISSDKRIGFSHMSVPGHDGRNGFGGACFPKDTLEFLEYSTRIDREFSILKESIKINDKIRSVYNDPTEREAEQNISFGNKQQEK